MKPDRSYLAARRQLEAMGGDSFEIGVRDRQGRMLLRTWSKAMVLESMAWLKRENALGAEVYVRPAGEQNTGLVLVDDLKRGQLARMKADGFAPASVVETSPDNFQAWVRVQHQPLDPKTATGVAMVLATQYEASLNSADWKHFGRLAGLTNNKPQHKDENSRSPYVLAHESNGKEAEAGQQLIGEVVRIHALQEKKHRLNRAKTAPEASNGVDPQESYLSQFKTLQARFGKDMDLSRADFAIGKQMALDGFSGEQIGQAIEQCSPELPMRKAGNEADYVVRTVKAAQDAAEIVRAQEIVVREEIARRQAEQQAQAARKLVERGEERSERRDRDRGLSR